MLLYELIDDPLMVGYAPYMAIGDAEVIARLLNTSQEGVLYRLQDGATTRQGSRAELLCGLHTTISRDEVVAALQIRSRP